MTAALNQSQTVKLAKICGMLGSDHDGERAAAALQASRLLREWGVSWSDLLQHSAPQPAPGLPTHASKRAFAVHAPTVAWALRHVALLTPWEANFLRTLCRQSGISRGQIAKLGEIVSDLRARGAA